MRRVASVTAFTLLLASALPARASERDLLNHCKALVQRVSQSSTIGTGMKPEETEEFDHCRQVIKEWTIRDSRRTVDEEGQPLR